MTNEAPSLPPPLPGRDVEPKLKRKGRLVKIIIGIAGAALLGANLLKIANTPSLELRKMGALLANDGRAVEITNVGTKPVTITKIVVNERDDCMKTTKSETLAIGEKTIYFSLCNIIRASVETDSGTASYSFPSN